MYLLITGSSAECPPPPAAGMWILKETGLCLCLHFWLHAQETVIAFLQTWLFLFAPCHSFCPRTILPCESCPAEPQMGLLGVTLCSGPGVRLGSPVLPVGIPDSGLAAGETARLALSARGAGSPAGGAGDTVSQLLVSPCRTGPAGSHGAQGRAAASAQEPVWGRAAWPSLPSGRPWPGGAASTVVPALSSAWPPKAALTQPQA